MSYKVKKGLDRPLSIYGMLLHFFYAWIGIGVAGFVILLLFVMKWSKGNGSLTTIGIIFLISIAVFLGSRSFFIARSRPSVKRGTYNITVSNMHITRFLK